jgi:hypothetical protein
MALGLTQPLNRNEYQQNSWGGGRGEKYGRLVRLTISTLSVSQLSKQCGLVDLSQPYRPPWPVTRIPSVFLVE